MLFLSTDTVTEGWLCLPTWDIYHRENLQLHSKFSMISRWVFSEPITRIQYVLYVVNSRCIRHCTNISSEPMAKSNRYTYVRTRTYSVRQSVKLFVRPSVRSFPFSQSWRSLCCNRSRTLVRLSVCLSVRRYVLVKLLPAGWIRWLTDWLTDWLYGYTGRRGHSVSTNVVTSVLSKMPSLL